MLIPAAVRLKTLFSQLEKIEDEINSLVNGDALAIAVADMPSSSVDTEPAAEPNKPGGRRSWAAVKVKPCCGSKINRHKKFCAAAAQQSSTARPKDLPGVMTLKCEKCGCGFMFRGDLLDAKCPDCRSTNVIESGDTPDSKEVFSFEPEL